MAISRAVTVVLLHNSVEEVGEGSVRIGGAGIAADTRVDILATREDTSLERNARGIRFVVILVPDIFG